MKSCFFRHDLGQVNRESVSVVQAKGRLAINHLARPGLRRGLGKQFGAPTQRTVECHFFIVNGRLNLGFLPKLRLFSHLVAPA